MFGAAAQAADATEQDPANRPADQEQGGERAGPAERRCRRRRGADRNAQQCRHGVGRDIVEQQTVEYVEAPAQPGSQQDRPLVRVHIEQGGSGCRRRERLFLPPLRDIPLNHEKSPFILPSRQ
jgi:pyruvate/2-oxoglutarate dehydrogenase complex dihydrolipoamide acyltransferase (E2) component